MGGCERCSEEFVSLAASLCECQSDCNGRSVPAIGRNSISKQWSVFKAALRPPCLLSRIAGKHSSLSLSSFYLLRRCSPISRSLPVFFVCVPCALLRSSAFVCFVSLLFRKERAIEMRSMETNAYTHLLVSLSPPPLLHSHRRQLLVALLVRASASLLTNSALFFFFLSFFPLLALCVRHCPY